MEIEFPSAEEAAARFPADVLDEAYESLEDAAWLKLAEGDAEDTFLHRHGEAELLLEQLMLVWNRLRDDRLRQVDWNRRSHELRERRRQKGIHSYSSADDPEFAELTREGYELDTALLVDYKSFFIFGDLLLGAYPSFSELAWDAPAGIEHTEGITQFWRSVDRVAYEPESTFGTCMRAVLQEIKALDHSLGFYRDKFIVHPPPDLSPSGSEALADPLTFEMSHDRLLPPAHAELQRLSDGLDKIAERENIDLSGDDPRSRLRQLNRMLPELDDRQSIKTARELLSDWGVDAPQALPTAQLLAQTLEAWARTLIDRVGLVEE